jgi:hypothetical protein
MFRAGLVLLALIAAVGLGDELLMRGARASSDRPEKTDTAIDSAMTAETAGADGALPAKCAVVQAPRPLPADLPEASGAAPSLRTPGLVFVQNDSRGPEVLAVDELGGMRGRIQITGAQITDWEDIAVARCAAGSCLYVGDIGDNHARRAGITVYRVPEPTAHDGATAPAEAFNGAYPDGPHDAEAMFALPDGSVYVLTKGETGSAALYRFPTPLSPGGTARLQRRVEFSGEKMKRRQRFTGAAASADGRWVAVRTLKSVEFYRAAGLAAGRPGTPLEYDLSALGEAQGEGIGFARGDTLVLSSEGGSKHTPGSISRITCDLPR